jgi:hypothetical protein
MKHIQLYESFGLVQKNLNKKNLDEKKLSIKSLLHIETTADLKKAVKALTKNHRSMSPDDLKKLSDHVAKRAYELDSIHLLPSKSLRLHAQTHGLADKDAIIDVPASAMNKKGQIDPSKLKV